MELKEDIIDAPENVKKCLKTCKVVVPGLLLTACALSLFNLFLGLGIKTTNGMTVSSTVQLADEWTRTPIIDIKIIDRSEIRCGDGYKELFTREWRGLDEGC